jgi:hypothetical protein
MSEHSVLDHVCERCEIPRRTEAELFAISAELDETLLYPAIDLTQESFRLPATHAKQRRCFQDLMSCLSSETITVEGAIRCRFVRVRSAQPHAYDMRQWKSL